MSAQSVFIDSVDHLAKCSQYLASAFTHTPTLWSLVDAAGVESYENAVKGDFVSMLDDWLDEPQLALRERVDIWATLHVFFASSQELTFSFAEVQEFVTSFDELLGSYMQRIPHELAEILSEQPDPQYVFPKSSGGYGDCRGWFMQDSTYSENSNGLDSDWCGSCRFTLQPAVTIGAVNDWQLTPKLYFADGTYITAMIVIPKSSGTSATFHLGMGNPAGNVPAGSFAIPIGQNYYSGGTSDDLYNWLHADTTNYANHVLLDNAIAGDGSQQEFVRIKELHNAASGISYTTDGAPEVITLGSGHGLSEGDVIVISGTGTALDGTQTVLGGTDAPTSTTVSVNASGAGGAGNDAAIKAYIVSLDPILNAWTTSHFVRGLYTECAPSEMASASGNVGDKVLVYLKPDRVPAL